MIVRTLVAAAALAVPVAADASTPEAWRALEARVARACVVKSGLTGARIVARMGFSDAVPIELRVIEGRERGLGRIRICAYSRATGAVEVQDAPRVERRR